MMKEKKEKSTKKRDVRSKEKWEKGITLIALVITIIVLLILAAVSIATLTGENGILTRAGEAKEQTAIADIIERAKIDIMGFQAENNGNITEESIDSILAPKYGTLSGEGVEKILTTNEGYVIKVSDIWSGGKTGVSIGDIFDSTGEIEGKLHIGDFINYEAGTWLESDMQKITESGAKIAANATDSLPTTDFQFGGFTLNSSRDGNAKEYSSSYNYVQETTSGGTKQAVTGWRLFDVAEDGVITLISAGCPEDYYHPSGTDYAYISEYILTGNVNSNADASSLGLGTTYRPRDWSMYVNNNYGATGATALTKKNLDDWYTKYTNTTNADTWTDATFQKIYKTDTNCVNNGIYESLIDNYSYYWLSSAGSSYDVYCVLPNNRYVGYRFAYGVRVLVSLSSEVKLSETSTGTKTVTSRGEDYIYNIWDLK